MKEFFKRLFSPVTNILESLKHGPEGNSIRKEFAACCFATAIYIAIKEVPAEQKITAMNSLLVTGCVCIGLVTGPQVIEMFSGKKEKPADNSVG